MARRDDGRAAAPEMIDHGNAERPAFGGVRSGSHFVEQHERRHGEIAIHGRDVGNMSGKRAETGVDRLLVADVGKE